MDRVEKPFWDHLEELRDRLFRCLKLFLVSSCLGYLVRQPILAFLKAPLFAVLPPDKQHLYFTGLFESFFNHLQVSMIVGFFVGCPYFFYEFWSFVAPGLHQNERRLMIPFIVSATIFFVSGAAFAYYLVLPYGFKFFIEFGQPQDVAMITVSEYFKILFRLLLLFGFSFELPVILVLLANFGLVNAEMLRKQRRTAILIIAVFGALFAPPDVFSMLLMMAPLYIFFEGATMVISIMEKKKSSREGK